MYHGGRILWRRCINFLPSYSNTSTWYFWGFVPWRHIIGGGGITYLPSLVKWNQILKKIGLWPPMHPLISTNHREELILRLYNYSSKLSIIILDWLWANSGVVGVEARRGFSWFPSNELMPPPWFVRQPSWTEAAWYEWVHWLPLWWPANSVQTGFARSKLSRGRLIRVSSLAAVLMAHQ